MATIELVKDQVIIDSEPEETILESTLRNGIGHAHACGGNALCSTCRVYIKDGEENLMPRTEEEQELAQQLGLLPEVRLACQTKIKGDIKIKRLVRDEVDEAIILKDGTSKKPRSLGVEKDASILFIDIADYTSFAENTPPYDVVHVLNRYFHITGKIIKRHGGKIIDYYGDGILAIFGLDDNPNHAQNLLNAGYEICDQIEEFDHDVHDLIDADFKIRLGAHSGPVIWGTIGIEGMQKEAAIGSTVNLASRIENANKQLNTRFLCSEEFFKRLSNPCYVVGEHEIEAKGKKGKFKVFSLDKLMPTLK